jgi:hypothetical protein
MKKLKRNGQPEMLPEYDFRGGVRGKYSKQYAQGTNIVILSPDVAKVYRTSQSVNKALRTLMKKRKTTAPAIHL